LTCETRPHIGEFQSVFLYFRAVLKSSRVRTLAFPQQMTGFLDNSFSWIGRMCSNQLTLIIYDSPTSNRGPSHHGSPGSLLSRKAPISNAILETRSVSFRYLGIQGRKAYSIHSDALSEMQAPCEESYGRLPRSEIGYHLYLTEETPLVVVAWAEPNAGPESTQVYMLHQENLVVLFLIRLLIDANCINPRHPGKEFSSQVPEGYLEIRGNEESYPITLQGLRIGR